MQNCISVSRMTSVGFMSAIISVNSYNFANLKTFWILFPNIYNAKETSGLIELPGISCTWRKVPDTTGNYNQ